MPETSGDQSRLTAAADHAMEVVEGAVYVVVGILLTTTAVVALAAIGYNLATAIDEGALGAATAALDGLLLVFILVELLGAVRATVAKRQLVAEPFLVVGMIASIKEIVVASLKAGSLEGDALKDAMIEIGVLGVVVLLLALASFLVRLKEREPTEG